MTPRLIYAAVLSLLAGALLFIVWRGDSRQIGGFTAPNARQQAVHENRFLELIDRNHLGEAHRVLSAQPHPAGSPRDRELARWIHEQFVSAGLESVGIEEHNVLLPWPLSVSVETVGADPWRATMREEPATGDPDTDAGAERPPASHAYSPSGEATGELVFAGAGAPDDYRWLRTRGIDVRGKVVLVRYSTPYSYRGFKVYTAEREGAAGILIYSDPADEGSARGDVYPKGPWGPDSRLQRGGVGYDFIVPGDPLTPGWASIPGAKRLEESDVVTLPRIVSAPLSARDAAALFARLGGPEAPAAWRGALPAYRVGPGPVTVRVTVQSDTAIRPIWTVTGLIRGTESPDDVVIVGNHRDAWEHGGVDPSTGSAALVEVVRALGALQRLGWRPKRSILFASWDAEELALTSSTEWGEQHAARLRRHAVAYLNVDSAASGPRFSAAAVPALSGLIEDVAGRVGDPEGRLSVAAAARDRSSAEAGGRRGRHDFIRTELGGGSDYAVFLNHLGVPVADFTFAGSFGVYHSAFDTHHYVTAFADPGFHRSAAIVGVWGLTAMRLASADVIPFDYEPYAESIEHYAQDLRRGMPDVSVATLVEAARALRAAAVDANARRDTSLRGNERDLFAPINQALMSVERGLVDDAGLPGRPWFKHLVYAPQPTYEPEMLPGVAEAVKAGDAARAEQQAARLVAGLGRATAALRAAANPGRE